MHEHESRRLSIESLKKEAKRWLSELRAGQPEAWAKLRRVLPDAPIVPHLREVQRALAAEHGHRGWIALQEQLLRDVAAQTHTLAQYDEKALALLDAYRTGTPEAMERHWKHTWHRRAWKGMRTYAQIGLGHAARDDMDITLDDARWLVAREHGFEDWDALCRVVSSTVSSTVSGTAQPTTLMAKPMALLVDMGERRAHNAEPVSIDRDWTRLLADAQDGEVVGIDARGQMTDALLADVEQLSHLTTLSLNGSHGVTDDGVVRLARLPNLQHLDLSGTAITDRGLAALCSLTQLRTLSLAHTRVTDSAIGALAGLSALERVDVGGTQCGDGAIRACAGKSALAHFSSGQATTDAGMAVFHDYPAFRQWQGGDVSMALLSYEAEPNSLTLRGQITDHGVAHLRGLDGLFALNLDDRALPLTGRALEPLVDMPHLGWLAFDAKDDAMPHIARMPSLRFLGCQDTTATDRGWVALSASQSIEYIWGRRCYGLERQGFLALARMPRLAHLSVSCRNVDDVGVCALPSFPALRELMPMDIPDAGYRHIGQCNALESLVLMYCRDTTDAATEHLAGLPQLAKYFASYTQITDRTPQLLSSMDTLTHVTFDGCAGLTNAGVVQLARSPALRELRVSGRGVTSAFTAAFGPAVTVHFSV